MSRIGEQTGTRPGTSTVSCFFIAVLAVSACSLPMFGQNADIGPDKIEELSQAVRHGSTEQKRDALFTIRNLQNETASRAAVPALSDSEEIVRATAAASVVWLPAVEAVHDLVPLLGDRSAFVRREAAYALGAVGSGGATGALLERLQREKDLEVRSAVVIALGKIGDPTVLERLVSILKDRPTESNEFIRRSAARSIGQIAQVLTTGERRVVTPENFLMDKYKDDPPALARPIDDQVPEFKRAVPVLSDVIRNKNESEDTRREAAYALGAIGGDAAAAVLQGFVNSPDPYLREIAGEALLKYRARK